MKGLRHRFERFCAVHSTKGIPNLMLYITIGSAIVYLLSMFDNSSTLYFALCFNRQLILQGQIWRLFTYVFTYGAGSSVLLVAISLLCYYTLGSSMERAWGTLRFNLFYFTGVVLMDLYAMLLGCEADVYYLNLSLFLGYATLYPNAQFLFLFIIPVRAWIFGLVDLALTLLDVVRLTVPVTYFPYNLLPLVAIANYFLFFGKDVLNLIPLSWRVKKAKPAGGPIPFRKVTPQPDKKAAPYLHRCTVCGRTDITNPELEFRYCSRCKGYFCYCEDHINNHNHVE